jgi:hypothetical protein
MLKAIHAGEDLAAPGRPRALHLTAAAEIAVTTASTELLRLSQEHWRRVKSSNPLQGTLREIPRRTRVVAALSALNRSAAPLRQIPGAEQEMLGSLSR